MSSVPLVSICIPVFNGEKYIAEAIDSALNQDYENIEIIIIDNNSTDTTLQIANSYISRGVKVFKNASNIGMAGNWNECIRKASGEFFKILPADDFLYKNCISKQVQAFKNSSKNLSVVSCARNVVNENGKPLISRLNKTLKEKQYLDKGLVIKLTFRAATNVIGEPGAVLLRKRDMIRCGSFVENAGYVVDLEYWLRMLDFGGLFFISEPLVSFRVSANSDSVRIIHRQADDVLRLLRVLYQNHPQTRRFDYYRAYLMTYLNVFAKFFFYKIFLDSK